MNAPTPATALAEPNVELVPLDTIAVSQTHIQQLRRKRFDERALTELAASMLKSGQLQPVLVRPFPSSAGQPGLAVRKYARGHRRGRRREFIDCTRWLWTVLRCKHCDHLEFGPASRRARYSCCRCGRMYYVL